MWRTVVRSRLADRRNDIEDELLADLRLAIPEGVGVVVVADRGFGDSKLFTYLQDERGFDFVIRFRAGIHVTDTEGRKRTAGQWMSPSGRAKLMRGVRLTQAQVPVAAVLLVRDPGMKDEWCIATSRPDLGTARLKGLYGRRFSCEELFRDIKDLRYGMGMEWSRSTSTDRRDRMMLLAILALALLTLLGQAGENEGLDRHLKANTVKRRTLSLMRQGCRWYDQLPNMREEWARPLLREFDRLLGQDDLFAALMAE